MTCRQPLPDKIRVARSFGNAAGSYDRFARLQRDIADRLFAQLDLDAAAILDLGSGTGYCAGLLAGRYPGATLCSLDIAEPMLALDRSRNTDAAHMHVCGDAEHLPFADDSFDLVFSNLTLQWCEQPSLVFREIHRILQRGGRALISTLAMHTLQELRACWRQLDAHVHVNEFLPSEQIFALLEDIPFARTTTGNSPEYYFYPSLADLARELKGIGANNQNAGQPAGLTGKNKLMKLRQLFEANHIAGKGIPVTYDLVMLELVK